MGQGWGLHGEVCVQQHIRPPFFLMLAPLFTHSLPICFTPRSAGGKYYHVLTEQEVRRAEVERRRQLNKRVRRGAAGRCCCRKWPVCQLRMDTFHSLLH